MRISHKRLTIWIDNIRRVIADIRSQMLEKVIENWTSRLDYIRASRGSHMPEIMFKISETKPVTLPSNYYGPLDDKCCKNSRFSLNCWELGHRRHKIRNDNVLSFTPDPVTTTHLNTYNVYPDIGTHGARDGMCRDRRRERREAPPAKRLNIEGALVRSLPRRNEGNREVYGIRIGEIRERAES
ncbi:hypothetical protein TNCV_1323361 [Trichonephila clavipes]|nr:hypothetical protein TNCV_1323361 [Trichonephila clavipes]